MAGAILTTRQLEFVMHLANGKRVDEIAAELHLSVSSVEKTIAKARKRTGARTVAHLVSIAIESGDLVWNDDDKSRYVQIEDAPVST